MLWPISWMCEKFGMQLACTMEYPYLANAKVGDVMVNLRFPHTHPNPTEREAAERRSEASKRVFQASTEHDLVPFAGSYPPRTSAVAC